MSFFVSHKKNGHETPPEVTDSRKTAIHNRFDTQSKEMHLIQSRSRLALTSEATGDTGVRAAAVPGEDDVVFRGVCRFIIYAEDNCTACSG
jgi:hypothetical protein